MRLEGDTTKAARAPEPVIMKTALLVTVCTIALVTVISLVRPWLAGMDMLLDSSQKSADGTLTLDACRSSTDTNPDHHAPYGQHVFLRKTAESSQHCTGDVLFAGYCRNLNAVWTADKSVGIECSNIEKLVTLGRTTRGVTVEFRESDSDTR